MEHSQSDVELDQKLGIWTPYEREGIRRVKGSPEQRQDVTWKFKPGNVWGKNSKRGDMKEVKILNQPPICSWLKKMESSDSNEPVIWCTYPRSYWVLPWADFTWYSKGSAWPYSLVLFLNHILSPGQVSELVRFFCTTRMIHCPLFYPETFPQRSWKPERIGLRGSHWIEIFIIIQATIYRVNVPTCVWYPAPFSYCNSVLFQEGVSFPTDCISCFSTFAALLEGFIQGRWYHSYQPLEEQGHQHSLRKWMGSLKQPDPERETGCENYKFRIPKW